MSRLPYNYYLELYLSGRINFDSYLYFKQITQNSQSPVEIIRNKIVCPCCGARLTHSATECFWCDWEDNEQ